MRKRRKEGNPSPLSEGTFGVTASPLRTGSSHRKGIIESYISSNLGKRKGGKKKKKRKGVLLAAYLKKGRSTS